MNIEYASDEKLIKTIDYLRLKKNMSRNEFITWSLKLSEIILEENGKGSTIIVFNENYDSMMKIKIY